MRNSKFTTILFCRTHCRMPLDRLHHWASTNPLRDQWKELHGSQVSVPFSESSSFLVLRKSHYHRYSISLALHIKIVVYVVAPSFTTLVGNICSGLSYQYLLRALSTHPLDAMSPSQARVCLYSALIISHLQEIFLTQGLNPGLPHCRQTFYGLSHQGSSESFWYGGQNQSQI